MAPDSNENLAQHHSEFAAFEEGYLSRYVALADTKATFVFGGAAAVITYLFGQGGVRELVFAPAWSPIFVLLTTAIAFLCLSALSAFATIAPRLATSGEGIVIFGVVAAKVSSDAYLHEIAGKTAADLTAARLKHCYDLSAVCD